MSQYTVFASVYDDFMKNIPYEEWAKMVDDKFRFYQVSGKLLELGCGTGKFSFLMEERGYEVTGIDCSPDMIKEAVKNARKLKSNCKFMLQDMRVLEQEEKFNAVVSVCDSMNYLREEFDLESVFEGVANVLLPNGIFLFDLKTESFYEELGEGVFTDETEEGNYIWKNFYDKDSRDNFYELTFFIKKRKNLYTRAKEEHVQHVFTLEEIERCAKKTGFVIKEMFIHEDGAQRVYYILERNMDNE